MTKLPFFAIAFFIFSLLIPFAQTFGSGGTLAVSYASGTLCGVVANQSTQHIVCYRPGQTIAVDPDISFSSISGGRTSLCGLRSGGYSLLCWDNLLSPNSSFVSKRIYLNDTVSLENISLGDDQICATVVGTGALKCWRGSQSFKLPSGSDHFASISSGSGFSCGILKGKNRVRCWGSGSLPSQIENGFGDMTMMSIVAGGSHICGLNISGFVVCKGENDYGQLNAPLGMAFEYSSFALGTNHSCAIRINGSVVCWGGRGKFSINETESFELIASGLNFTCGLTTRNFSIVCWGPGWPNPSGSDSGVVLNFPEILPGPCVESSCGNCDIYPLSQKLCNGRGSICRCPISVPSLPTQPLQLPPSVSPPLSESKGLRRGLLAFAIAGSVGAFAGICTFIYWLCFGHQKIHNSVQPTTARHDSSNAGVTSNNIPSSRTSSIRRQRSGTSSKHADRAEEFPLSELASATNNFSMDSKIGSGSFGIVYRGKLSDGREVAIKRLEIDTKGKKKFQEKENAFESELAFLSRLHHKHLVRLVGYCEEKDERLLVYEYMKNGALYDHLHDNNNVEKHSSFINSWKLRIKIGLDAARGIEYLHNYAVPPIIHRDIKSSNILLDANWTARVSDFGLSLMRSESERHFTSIRAAGTAGYIDPEYYSFSMLTAKSDAYGLGVVLLELLTGKRAIFKKSEEGGSPVSVVDFAVPAIMSGELEKILDQRVDSPRLNEAEAVELVAYTAMHCVNLEGKDRPTITDIVANLERALTLCDDSHGSISSGTFSIVSD